MTFRNISKILIFMVYGVEKLRKSQDVCSKSTGSIALLLENSYLSERKF